MAEDIRSQIECPDLHAGITDSMACFRLESELLRLYDEAQTVEQIELLGD